MTTVENATGPGPVEKGAHVVDARDLTRRYGPGDTAVDALRGVSLDVHGGQLVAVMGPSGSGKSTLMHILAGLDKPTSGTVSIAGTEITTLDDARMTRLRRTHIGFVFQFFNLLPMLTAAENVVLPLSIAGEEITSLDDSHITRLRRKHIGFVFQFFNLLPMLTAEENIVLPLSIAGEKPDAAWLAELLEKTGLTNRASHRPSEISGGQQQRVAIARALVTRPTILFADEPTGNLDSKTGGEILDLMRDSVETYGQTTVMVTHEARAASIADRVLFIADGLIVQELKDTTAGEVLEVMSRLQS